jgi:hypothetical protein
VEIGGKRIGPSVTTAGFGTDMPASVVVVLAILALGMLAGAAFAVQRRWPAAWQTAGGALGRPLRRLRDRVRRGISRGR